MLSERSNVGSLRDAWGPEDETAREPLRPLFSSDDLLWFIIIVLCGLALLGVHEIRVLHDQVHQLQAQVK
jgi:hypothetical protein